MNTFIPHISSLRLTDFRNYNDLDLSLNASPVVLYGANGSGKTNLMEAVSLLTPGRGLRRAQLAHIARKTEDQMAPIWGVAAQLCQSDTDDPLRIGVGQVPSAPGRRTVRVDGKNASGTDLAKLLSVMWLTPAQDRLFTGPASDRRGFLDRFALAHAPNHGKAVIRYEKSRSERNRLLSDGIDDALWFDALEADMAEHGAHIAQARALTIAELRTDINARASGGIAHDFPHAALWLNGEAEELYEAGADLTEVEDFIRTHLRADRRLDQRAGRTLRGIHKTDLIVRYADKNMLASDCSTGEQKALLIGLVLAQARALDRCQSGRKPILLLDEIAAHLDVSRRAGLIEELLNLNSQVFMTGTDASLFEAFEGRAQSFEVKQGVIKAA